MTETERIFQEYEGFTVEFMPNGHRYALIEQEADGPVIGSVTRRAAVSVTTVTGSIDKGGLPYWGERLGREGLSVRDEMKRTQDLGTETHFALETYAKTGQVPVLSDFNPEARGFVRGLAGWLLDASPEPLLVEQILGSPTYGLAGRPDLIANIGGVRTLVDLKTTAAGDDGKGVEKKLGYPEPHLQLAGYQLMFAECGIEPVERAIILAVDESGSYDREKNTKACVATGDQFLDLLAAHRSVAAVRASLRAAEKAQVMA